MYPRSFTEHLLCARPWIFLSSLHPPQYFHLIDEDIEAQRGRPGHRAGSAGQKTSLTPTPAIPGLWKQPFLGRWLMALVTSQKI